VNIPVNDFEKDKLAQFQDKKIVFLCRSGNRTQMNKHIFAEVSCREKYFLSGGLMAWKSANLPLVTQCSAPIDIMRQVQIIVSLMVLLGLALNFFVSPYFLWLPAIAGIGLLVAGITGFCGMAKILALLPWNKPKK
jgi:3-mercaptopyruvate sulfurtransferase SseA